MKLFNNTIIKNSLQVISKHKSLNYLLAVKNWMSIKLNYKPKNLKTKLKKKRFIECININFLPLTKA